MHEISPPEPRLLATVQEACAELRIARTSIYKLINQNKIGVIKIGRRTLIPRAELVRFTHLPN